MLTAFIYGVLLGLSAGLAPGPLLALVAAQSLRHGPREGCKVALTPLATDAPIILIALLLASQLAQMHTLLGIVSIAGGIFVMYLAWENLRPAQMTAGIPGGTPNSWLKGILTNLLSPHPWLFWMTVGAATLAKAMAQGWTAAVAFLAGFYLLLVGSKVVIALVVGKSRNLLAGRGYRLAMRGLGVLLAVFAVLLFRQALRELRVI